MSHYLEKFIPLAYIAEKMLLVGLSKEFVFSLIPLAFRYEGVFDLMMMWKEESDLKLKESIIEDLQKEIEEENLILERRCSKKPSPQLNSQ